MQHRHSNIRTRISLDDLSNAGLAVRRYGEGGATSPAEDHCRRRHAAYIWFRRTSPDSFDPSTIAEATVEGIHALNREMDAAGVTKFAYGLGAAHTLRAQPNGELLLTDRPYLETEEHVGDLSILECADLDEVLA